MKTEQNRTIYVFFLAILFLSGLFFPSCVRATEALAITQQSPGNEGTLNGTDETISLTFNQPVEIFAGDYPDIFLMEDQDGDGTGDHILEESEMDIFGSAFGRCERTE